LSSPLDPLSRRERGQFRTPGLWLPLARAERGRGGQGGEGMFKPKTDSTKNIGLFAVSSSKNKPYYQRKIVLINYSKSIKNFDKIDMIFRIKERNYNLRMREFCFH
jgi:hypothetical protein